MVYLVLIIKTLLEISIVILVYLAIALIMLFIVGKLQSYYENWKTKKRNWRWEREHKEFMQRCYKRELEQKLRKEEREKYPLFYWKELTNE